MRIDVRGTSVPQSAVLRRLVDGTLVGDVLATHELVFCMPVLQNNLMEVMAF